MQKVGVIIPFYNGNKYLKLLLDSILEAADCFDIRVFVIDNSRNGERVDRGLISNPGVYVIDAGTGIGYGKACNVGYRLCLQHMVDIVVIANQDGYFGAGSLGLMVTKLLSNEEYSVAVPLLTKYETDDVERFFTHVYLSPMEELVSDLFRGTTRSFYPIHQLCGACFALKTHDYKKFDYLFDELFYMYYEDADLYERLTRMKLKLIFLPGAVFHHKHSNTDESMQTVRFIATQRTSRHIFYIKNRPVSTARTLLAWGVLEVRTIIEYCFKLQGRLLLAEVLSCLNTFLKMPAVITRRNVQKVY